MDLDKVLITTVVGSFPGKPNKKSMMSSYYEKEDPYLDSLREAVNAQVDAGIELVSDGQTRGGMIEIFAEGLKGFRIKEKIEIISDIEHIEPITLEDIKETRSIIPASTGLKGIITGPWTIVNSVEDQHYDSKMDAVLDTTEALKKEAEILAEYCDVIQIDEPYFSVEFPDYGEECIEKITDLDTKTALHVCGDIEHIVEELVEMEIDILDHEFAANPHLYEVFKDLSFDQRVAVGAVTTRPDIEEIEEIKDNINRAYDIFGPKTMIDPDCGLKNLKKETARNKLENMVIARNVVLNERNRKIRS
ncbi:MAG: methionine synthase [Candidatus Thermoplasmatota archaeon]|nr:methionine synthase [Candidatus Thermoplasmatota archaeon]